MKGEAAVAQRSSKIAAEGNIYADKEKKSARAAAAVAQEEALRALRQFKTEKVIKNGRGAHHKQDQKQSEAEEQYLNTDMEADARPKVVKRPVQQESYADPNQLGSVPPSSIILNGDHI